MAVISVDVTLVADTQEELDAIVAYIDQTVAESNAPIEYSVDGLTLSVSIPDQPYTLGA